MTLSREPGQPPRGRRSDASGAPPAAHLLPRLPRLALAVALLAGCGGSRGPAEDASPPPPPWVEEVTAESGVDFRYVRAITQRYWFPEIMGGGAAWLDYDGDGDLDLYLVQGGDLANPDSAPDTPLALTNHLYRNDGDRFVDVTYAAGAGDSGYGMGAVVGDFDGDGDPDLYVTNVGPNALYRNDGDGTFSRLTAGVEDPGWGTSGAAVDYDGDGDLDLWVVNYVHWSPETELDCYGVGGGRDYCHPSRYESPAGDRLFRNDGGLRFTDVTTAVGLDTAFGNGLGIAVLDFDGDGLTDVYVANDGMPNQLWMSTGPGRFAERAVPLGCAVNGMGTAEAGMGVAPGDVDGDGRFDLLLTHLARESNTLYLNRDGFCEDVTTTRGLAAASLAHTGFGTALADFDHDGRLDLWVSNGRVGRETAGGEGDPFAEPDHLYRGLEGGVFELLPPAVSGLGAEPDNGRAAAFADYDGDGDVDAVVVNNGDRARLYRNGAASRPGGRHWLELALADGDGTAALGARVRLTTAAGVQWRQTQRAYSYCASHDPRAHFGLGEAGEIVELRIEPLAGTVRSYRRLPAGRIYRALP